MKVLVAGIGEVGRYLLEFLARSGRDLEIVAADQDLASLQKKVDNTLFGASLEGRTPKIRAVALDLLDVDRTAELIGELQPEIVVNCAVMQTWHVIRRLPEPLYERLSSAGLGAWLPVQLTLAMKLGQALAKSGVSAHYVNTSLSDLTNPVLGAIGLAPTIGIGNVALIATAIRELIARKSGCSPAQVEVRLVAHHVHWVLWREAGYREGAPFYLKVRVSGEDVTEDYDPRALMKEAILLYPSGTSFSAVSASSAIQNILALLSPEPVRTHSPGPIGLPGGYPVRMSSAGASVDLPDDLSLEQAVEINREAQRYDGIDRIEESGRVHFMPYAAEIMSDMLGFDRESFTPVESEELAREQIAKFRALEARHRT